MIREATVMGQFYPAKKSKFTTMIESWERETMLLGTRIAIVPHAGYVFSGECAWQALTQIDWNALTRVIVIGPSHKIPFKGVSISLATEYETIEDTHLMDKAYSKALLREFSLTTIVEAHLEHSTEVQIPFIHELAPHLPIIELVYGRDADEVLYDIISTYINDPETGILVSSDLSHYYSKTIAQQFDTHITQAVETLDLAELLRGEACGMLGIEALLASCKQHNRTMRIVDYRTSAESKYGDETRVVGYLSALMQ